MEYALVAFALLALLVGLSAFLQLFAGGMAANHALSGASHGLALVGGVGDALLY